MLNLLSISIIIPCRNEKEFIKKCLDSIIANDYPKEKFEILIIDGMSEDGTREIIKRYGQRYGYIKLLDNPKTFIPVALNIGIKNAQNDIIIRMDVHATYKKDYISKCLKYLKKYEPDNVGGIWIILPRKNTLLGKAIALVISHPFGTGNAYYKIGAQELKLVDTVPFGCYRKKIFKKYGFFNENLKRSQDMEFNLRLKRKGGKILLIPEIVGYYYVRSDFKNFFVHNFVDGIWAIRPLKFTKRFLSFRHYVPLISLLSLLLIGVLGFFSSIFWWLFLFTMVLYILTDFYFSAQLAIKEKDLRFVFVLPFAFAIRHIGYGLGSLWGLIKLI